jgi:hypothetical protein
MVVFDGEVLHGVVPGKGVVKEAEEAEEAEEGEGRGERTTLMFAFWEDIRPREGGIGAARLIPAPASEGETGTGTGTGTETETETEKEWVKFYTQELDGGELKAIDEHEVGEVNNPAVVDGLFERVDGGKVRGIPDINDVFTF